MLNFIRRIFSKDKKLYNSLKNILGFYPKNIALYKLAFKHSSVAEEIINGAKDSNDRLEYLGDSVLGTVVAHHLFKIYPFKDEGFLTKLRSKLVSRQQLNRLAIKIGLDHFVKSNLERSAQTTSIYGDAFEALIGAIYLDQGYFITQQFIIKRIINLHLDITEIENTENDYKSKLIEWSQKTKKELRFHLADEFGEGPEKQYILEIIVEGEVRSRIQHFSKRKAEQIAAAEVFKLLQLDE